LKKRKATQSTTEQQTGHMFRAPKPSSHTLVLQRPAAADLSTKSPDVRSGTLLWNDAEPRLRRRGVQRLASCSRFERQNLLDDFLPADGGQVAKCIRISELSEQGRYGTSGVGHRSIRRSHLWPGTSIPIWCVCCQRTSGMISCQHSRLVDMADPEPVRALRRGWQQEQLLMASFFPGFEVSCCESDKPGICRAMLKGEARYSDNRNDMPVMSSGLLPQYICVYNPRPLPHAKINHCRCRLAR
jgi:hypothetical protein